MTDRDITKQRRYTQDKNLYVTVKFFFQSCSQCQHKLFKGKRELYRNSLDVDIEFGMYTEITQRKTHLSVMKSR